MSTNSSGYASLIGELIDDVEAWQAAQARGEVADRRDGAVYDVAPDLLLAVNVALATGRPLLLRGEPGSGKSSFAAYLARNLNWRYYEHVVSSTTIALDLLWQFDAVRRLSDAQAQRPIVDASYVEPGPLWWMLDPDSAARRGSHDHDSGIVPPVEPLADVNASRREGHAVLLIDELDKADPDVPNALLVPLSAWTFTVAETGTRVNGRDFEERLRGSVGGLAGIGASGRMLVIITTNEERQLPPAFLRRCVVHSITPPDAASLQRIAVLHTYGPGDHQVSSEDTTLFEAVAAKLEEVRWELVGGERLPGTAEYLDAVHACRELGIRPDESDDRWRWLVQATMVKQAPA
jgi:MoxR-like ATPase